MGVSPTFLMGMMVGALALWLAQRWRRGGRAIRATTAREVMLGQQNDRLAGELAGLRQRLAVLESIATDPAHRTVAEIEALRG